MIFEDKIRALRVSSICVDQYCAPSPVCRLNDETKSRKELEKDLEDLKKTIEDTRLNRLQTQKEIDLVNAELARLEHEHTEVRLNTNTSRSNNKTVLCELGGKFRTVWLL